MNHFTLERYCYPGSNTSVCSRPTVYSLVDTPEGPTGVSVNMDPKAQWCHIHGAPCIGHIEVYEDMVFLPLWMTPSSSSVENPLHTLKLACVRKSSIYPEYIAAVLSLLRGKTGCLRSINSMVVQGSLKMVISPDIDNSDATVKIPRYIAQKCLIPNVVGGSYTRSTLADCSFGLLVRQPCMWTGGIQPVRIELTDPDVDAITGHDVNASMKVPIHMCGPYGADFDGDEMTLFGVCNPTSEAECASFVWDYSKWNPYSDALYNSVVGPHQQHVCSNTKMLAMCTTLCWSDRTEGVACVDAHTKWLTSKSAFIAMKSAHESAHSLCLKAINSLAAVCSKSGSQSDVGAVARRSKIGAERVYLTLTLTLRCPESCFCLHQLA
jgi:hypothetical protein